MNTQPITTASGRSVPTDELLAALQKYRGKIAPAARDLRCSRAYIHEQITGSADMKAAVERMRVVQSKEVLAALAALRVDPDDVAVRVMARAQSPRAATMAVILEGLAAATHWPKRELASELEKPQYRKRIDDLLPVAVAAVDAGPKRALQVSIRHDQRQWLNERPRGTAPTLLSSVEEWPAVEEQTPANLFHTSYYLPVAVADAIVARAEELDCSISAVVRTVLDRAIANEAPLSVAA